MKQKILVIPDGNWLAHTTRPLEIAKELRALGYDLQFAGQGSYMQMVRDEGFETRDLETLCPERNLKCSRSGRVNWYDYELIDRLVKEELDLLCTLKPELVLCDFRHTLSTSCELAGIPLASILNASWTNYYSVNHEAPEHLIFTRVLGKRIVSKLMPLVKGMIISVDSAPFKKYRKENGLAPNKNIWDVWKGDLNLMTDIPEYAPTTGLPDNFHYIGPIVWNPDIPVPEWIYSLNPSKKTIYITMGSTGYERFFTEMAEMFAGTEYQCLMTTAGMVELKNIPENFYVTEYAPGDELMKRSDLVICHGGNGTIYQALSEGVPIIGIPTMHDQEFNLQRVEALGAGVQVSELSFKQEDLMSAVNRIIGDSVYKQKAGKLKEILKNYDAPKRGAGLIDTFLNPAN